MTSRKGGQNRKQLGHSTGCFQGDCGRASRRSERHGARPEAGLQREPPWATFHLEGTRCFRKQPKRWGAWKSLGVPVQGGAQARGGSGPLRQGLEPKPPRLRGGQTGSKEQAGSPTAAETSLRPGRSQGAALVVKAGHEDSKVCSGTAKWMSQPSGLLWVTEAKLPGDKL